VVFLKWSAALKAGQVPVVSEQQQRKLRLFIHVELTCLALIILNAALMAKGIGYEG
jgi:putative membrane protein